MPRPDKSKTFRTNLRNRLSEYVPGFTQLHIKYQLAACYWLTELAFGHQYDHSVYEGASFIHCRDRNALLGNATYQLFLEHGIVKHTNYSRDKHYTRGYYLTEKGRDIFNFKVEKTQVQDIKGQLLRNAEPHAIMAKDLIGNSRKTTGNIPAIVRINIDALERLKAELRGWKHHYQLGDSVPDRQTDSLRNRLTEKRGREKKIEWLNRALFQAHELMCRADTDYLPKGCIEQLYTESNTGRIYHSNRPHLQGAIREIRLAALSDLGCFDYDIENCHFMILKYLAEQQGIELPAVADYIARKKAIREQLASDLDIHTGRVKLCLISLVYGSRQSLYWDGAIRKAIGKAKAAKLFQHKLFAGLANDVKQATKPILAAMPRANLGKHITNAIGKTMLASEKPESQLAHVLQGVETKMLNAAMEQFGNDICLIQHDGFTATKTLNESAIRRVIFDATGIDVNVTSTAL